MIKNLISERYRHIEPSSMMKTAAVAAGIRGSIDLTLGEPDISTPPEICEALYEAAKGGDPLCAGNGAYRTALRDIGVLDAQV